MKLNHILTKWVAESGVFNDVTSYAQMEANIIRYGETLDDPADAPLDPEKQRPLYKKFVGAALEVLTEFFFNRAAGPLLGVKSIQDTSRNEYEPGKDFDYVSYDPDPDYRGPSDSDLAYLPGRMQTKFRASPKARLTRVGLGSFISVCDEHDIPKRRRILFTNLSRKGEDAVFAPDYRGFNQMRVIGREDQQEFIDRDPNFWQDLDATVKQALIYPTDFEEAPELWDYQRDDMMATAIMPLLDHGGRCRMIAATGAGKTNVMHRGIEIGFERRFKLQIMVEPTIDLAIQTHNRFQKFNLFHRGAIPVYHFRSGESCADGFMDYTQQTDEKVFLNWFETRERGFVFVTYKSMPKLIQAMLDKGIIADFIYWDEFHHLMKQTKEQRELLLSIPADRNLFTSASIRMGKIICGFKHVDLFGPIKSDITRKNLAKRAIAPPKTIIKVIRGDGTNIKGLTEAMKTAAERDGYDLRTGVIEAAGVLVANADMMATTGSCHLLTCTKRSALAKEIATNPKVAELSNGALMSVVVSGTPDRDKIIAAFEASNNAVINQHSIFKEGKDTVIDSLMCSRTMNGGGFVQALGRIRGHKTDITNMKAGKLSVDDPAGWVRYNAYVYVVMHNDETSETFREMMKDLIIKLEDMGLSEDDYDFVDVTDQRHGPQETTGDGGDDLGGLLVPLPRLSSIIGEESLKSAVKSLKIEIENTERREMAELEKQAATKAYVEKRDVIDGTSLVDRMTQLANLTRLKLQC